MSRWLCLAGLPACTDVTNIIPEKVRFAKGVRTKNRKKEKISHKAFGIVDLGGSNPLVWCELY